MGVGIRRFSDGDVPSLHPAEQELLRPRAVERRRAYFALGRAAARDALVELGLPAAPIGRGPAGEPLWPDGVVGAIAHAGDIAVAVVGRTRAYAGLGVDVEERARGPSARAARLVARPSEMAWLEAAPDPRRLTMLFSAKEAVFKAVFPLERVWLGFGDAELTWVPEWCGFSAVLLKRASASFGVGSVLRVYCTVTGSQVLSSTYCLS